MWYNTPYVYITVWNFVEDILRSCIALALGFVNGDEFFCAVHTLDRLSIRLDWSLFDRRYLDISRQVWYRVTNDNYNDTPREGEGAVAIPTLPIVAYAVLLILVCRRDESVGGGGI